MSTSQSLPQGWSSLPPGWSTSPPKQTDPVVTASPEKPGFLESAANAVGLGDLVHPQQSQGQQHPMKSFLESYPPVALAKSAYGGAKDTVGELEQAGESLGHHNPAEAAIHGIQAIPFVGRPLVTAAEQVPVPQPGESYMGQVGDAATDPGTMGTLTGTAATLAPLVLGGADAAAPGRSLVGEIPTRAKAGQLFQSIMQDAGDKPVNLTRTMEPLERAQQLSSRGHGTVSSADNLYKRINTVNPLDYREARDWASGLGTLTGEDKINATPTLKSQVKQLSRAFNEDVGDTAKSVGRGEDYEKAMRDYRRASQIRGAAIKAAQYGIPAAGIGIAGHYLRDLIPQR